MEINPKEFITTTELQGVLIIKRPTFDDPRGFFRETYRKTGIEQAAGISFEPVQANHSHSQKNTLRGLHIAPWHKLVTCVTGEIQQVVADLRKDSPTFGRYISVILNESNRASVFVPSGCANSFLTLSDTSDYLYLVTDYWHPDSEKGILYNDPDLHIDWQTEQPLLSEKDAKNQTLRELMPEQF